MAIRSVQVLFTFVLMLFSDVETTAALDIPMLTSLISVQLRMKPKNILQSLARGSIVLQKLF